MFCTSPTFILAPGLKFNVSDCHWRGVLICHQINSHLKIKLNWRIFWRSGTHTHTPWNALPVLSSHHTVPLCSGHLKGHSANPNPELLKASVMEIFLLRRPRGAGRLFCRSHLWFQPQTLWRRPSPKITLNLIHLASNRNDGVSRFRCRWSEWFYVII